MKSLELICGLVVTPWNVKKLVHCRYRDSAKSVTLRAKALRLRQRENFRLLTFSSFLNMHLNHKLSKLAAVSVNVPLGLTRSLKPGSHERHKHKQRKQRMNSPLRLEKTKQRDFFFVSPFVLLFAYAWTMILCLCLWRSLCRRLDLIPLFCLLFFPYAYAYAYAIVWIRLYDFDIRHFQSHLLLLSPRVTEYGVWYIRQTL